MNIWILAQGENQQTPKAITSEPVSEDQTTAVVAADPNATPAPTQRQQGPANIQWIFFAILIVFIWLFLFRGPRKKQQEHRKMIQSLQKNDKIRTIGGIYGTVVDVKDDEIVIKVDEATNTKIRISPNAVGVKLSQDKS